MPALRHTGLVTDKQHAVTTARVTQSDPTPNVKLTVYINGKNEQQLHELAARTRRTKSELVNEALVGYLAGSLATKEDETRG